MGIIKQGVLGGFSGKVGPVIGAFWKGIAYMRSIPATVANPKTDAQLTQRSKYIIIAHFLNPVVEFLRVGFKNYAIKMSQYNAAFKYNVLNALTGTYPNFAVNYANALLSKGQLPGALNQVAASTVAATILFTWDDNSAEIGALATDSVLIVVYNAIKHQAVTISNLAERGDGTITVTVPDSFSGDQVHCYIAFQTSDHVEQSNSKYAGAVTVA